MKRFVVSVLFIVVTLFLIDRIGGVVLKYCSMYTYTHAEIKMEHLIRHSTEDVILLGTSRVDNHYVPSIIKDTLQMTVYNGGISSSDNIFSHYIVLNDLLSHHVPKIVCLEIMKNDFVKSDHFNQFISFFAPYIGISERADSVYKDANTLYLYNISHLYRFNSKVMETMYGLIVHHTYSKDNGYIANPKPSKVLGEIKKELSDTIYDMQKLKYIEKFIDVCKMHNIQLIFTISPRYLYVENSYYKPIYEIARKHKVPILDYHSSGLFHNHPEYFSNPGHMWDEGARKFSSIFAHDLKAIINNTRDF